MKRPSYRTVDPGMALTQLGRGVVGVLGAACALVGIFLLIACGDDLRFALAGLLLLAASLPMILRNVR